MILQCTLAAPLIRFHHYFGLGPQQACAMLKCKTICSPFALTQFAFPFGKADWSLICSKDSGGSWYSRLLERLLLLFFPSFIFDDPDDLSEGAVLVFGENASVRGINKGDRLAVVPESWTRRKCYPDEEVANKQVYCLFFYLALLPNSSCSWVQQGPNRTRRGSSICSWYRSSEIKAVYLEDKGME